MLAGDDRPPLIFVQIIEGRVRELLREEPFIGGSAARLARSPQPRA